MGKICDRCDTKMIVTFRKGDERICVDCHNKEVKERQTSEADVRLNNLLATEQELRKLLWLNHGCPVNGLYGDDGEMQCGACMTDFKRDATEQIKINLQRR